MPYRRYLYMFVLCVSIGTAWALFQPNEVFAATRTWDGGGVDNYWNTAGNWIDDVVPVAGDSLVFDATGVGVRPSPSNNITNLTSFGSITVSAAGYTLSGNSVSLVTGLIVDTYSSGTSTVSLIIGGAGSVTMSATGSGTLILSGTNTFTGGLFVRSGTVTAMSSSRALGGTTGTGTVTIGNTSGSADATLMIGVYGEIYANPIILATGNTGTLTIGNTGTGSYTTFSGGVTGTNNLTINSNSSGAITFATASINNSGTITHIGAGTGTVTISGGVGTNVTGITQNSSTSDLFINTAPITVNTGGTTLTNTAGIKKIRVFSGVIGVGNLTLNNNSATVDAVTVETASANNAGTITNSGLGSGRVTISGGVGANVTGITQNSITSGLTINNTSITVNTGGTTFTNIAGTKLLTVDSDVIGTGNLTLNNNSSTTDAIALSSTAFVNNAGTITNSGSGSGSVKISGGVGSNVTGITQNSSTSGLNINPSSITVNAGGTTLIRSSAGTANFSIYKVTGTGDLILQNNNTTNSGILITTVYNIGAVINSGSGTGTVALTNVGIEFVNVTSVIQNSATSQIVIGGIYLSNSGTTLVNNAGALLVSEYGVSGTGNLILNNNSSITNGIVLVGLAGSPINHIGTITNSGTGTGSVSITANVGSNVTAIIQDSATSAFTISPSGTRTVTVNAGGTTLMNTGGSPLTVSTNIIGTGNLIINNNTSTTNGITLSSTSVNNIGTITNSGTGSGSSLISGVLGTSVTGMTQNSSTSSLRLTGANTYTGSSTITAGTLYVDGAQAGSSIVLNGGTLSGIGTVGSISVTAGGSTVSPGGSPGILNSGNVDWSGGATTFFTELNGTVASTSYDQLNVIGTVNLGGATLNGTAGFSPLFGDTFTIINNDSTDAVTGTFAGLLENAIVTVGGLNMRISYVGGSGNDVVLTSIGSVDATKSTLTPTSASIEANGFSSQLLTVTARYADGSSVMSGGETVVITISAGTGTIGAVTDNSDGTYSATVTSPTSAGSGTFVATIAGAPVKNGTEAQMQAVITYTPEIIPTIQWTVSSSTSDEGLETTILTAELSTTSERTITADVALSGSAVGDGTDYSFFPVTLSFPSGSLTRNVVMTLTDDNMDETDETVIFTLTNLINATPGATTVHTITVTDNDDLPTISWLAPTQTVEEASGTTTITAVLSAPSGKTVTAAFGVSGTAIDGTDYSYSPTSITFSPGSTTADVDIILLADGINENDESVIFQLSSGVNATITGGTDTVIITDNDALPVIEWSTDVVEVNEDAGTVTLTAELSTVSGIDVQATFGLTGTAVDDGIDYVCSPTSVLITAGQLSADITVSINKDLIDENNETAIFTLTGSTNALLGTTIEQTLTIFDDDAPPDIEWTLDSFSFGQASGITPITVNLSAVSGRDITAHFSLSGTAVGGGVDYTTPSTDIFIPAGSLSTDVNITVTDDMINEDDETVILTLTDATNATLGASSAVTMTIVDNDDPPTISWTIASSSYNEDAGVVPVTATLSAPSGKDITAVFILSGTATGSEEDYSYIPTSISIPAGETFEDVDVSLENDTIYEQDETVIFTLVEGVNVTLGPTTTHTLTVLNDLSDRRPGGVKYLPPPVQSSVVLLRPNSGESFVAGTVVVIGWRTAGNTSNANLYYSVDDGVSWVSIVKNISAYANSYLWTVPNVATENARIKIELTDLVLVVAQSTSDAVFTISLPQSVLPPVVIIPEASGRFLGSFVKKDSSSTVYYIDQFARRHSFFNPIIYSTYSDSFRQVIVISNEELSHIPTDILMPPKYGVVLVKFVSSFDVYVVTWNPENDYHPILRHIPDEETARSLFGEDWSDYVIDLDVTTYVSFDFGRDVEVNERFDKSIMKTRIQIMEYAE